MKVFDVSIWLATAVGFVVMAFVVLVAFCICAAAGRADQYLGDQDV